MSDSLRDDVYKAIQNAGCKPKIVAIGEGRPSKSWLEIYTENIEKETARKIFADIDQFKGGLFDRYIFTNKDIDELKKKYKVGNCSKR